MKTWRIKSCCQRSPHKSAIGL